MLPEKELRVAQLAHIGRQPQIQEEGIIPTLQDMAYQSGFPALSRPYDGRYRVNVYRPLKIGGKESFNIYLHIEYTVFKLQSQFYHTTHRMSLTTFRIRPPAIFLPADQPRFLIRGVGAP